MKYLPIFFFVSVNLLYVSTLQAAQQTLDTVAKDDNMSIESPGEILSIELFEEDGEIFYKLLKEKVVVIEKSKLGVLFKKGGFDSDLEVTDLSRTAFDETWTQPWGEVKNIRNNYTELKLFLENDEQQKMNITVRLYDYGLGFRYEWPEQDNLRDFVIMNELTQFNLSGEPLTWSIDAYIPNRSEHLYLERPLSEIDSVQTPLTMQAGDSLYLSFHEAALTDFAAMNIVNNGDGHLEADLVPWKNGDKVRASTPHVSPWRTVQVAEKPGDLITDYLILNLNEPGKIEDTSWIKPAKYTGIWWDMHLGTKSWGSGPTHGATTEYTKYMMDFAAKHGFYGVLVEGWNTGWDGNWFENGDVFSFTETHPEFDLKEVIRYGDSLGVKLIGHHETSAGISNYESQVDDAFALYNDLGVEAVKTGYVGDFVEGGEWHHGQFMVRHYRKIVKKAAEAGIMLDVHEPIKDTGIRRTWPNMMTREGARGREYDAWSEDGGNPPSHTTTIPFTRLLGGPMDYTPGTFNLLLTDKPDNPDHNRVQSTIAKELALYVVIYSPLHMVSDLPKNLEANSVALKFVKEVPVDWEKTVVLDAAIGDYIVTARKDRNSDNWYMGAITNEDARDLTVSLDFLEPGVAYEAIIYQDGDANWETAPYLMSNYGQKVTSEYTMKVKMGPGGGMAVKFRKM